MTMNEWMNEWMNCLKSVALVVQQQQQWKNSEVNKCNQQWKTLRNMKIPQATFFQKSVSFNSRKESRKLWFVLSKFNQKIWIWRFLGTLVFSYFVWLAIFSNVITLRIISNFVNNIYHIVIYHMQPLQPW